MTTERGVPSASSLAFHMEPLPDYYFQLRALAAGSAPVPERHAEAVAPLLALQEHLGSFGGWGWLDTRFLTATTPQEVLPWARALEDPVALRGGREVSLRGTILALCEALGSGFDAFLEDEWPARRVRLEATLEELRHAFVPGHRAALADLMAALAITDPGLAAPVFLVTETNAPGAYTFRLGGGGGAVVVATAGGPGTTLFETLLHEAVHVLDVATEGDGDALTELRRLLEERGVSRRDRLWRDAPHVLMFLQAGATVRSIYDRGHVDYGETTGLYERLGRTAEVARPVRAAYLRGERGRSQALREIAISLTIAAEPEPPAGSAAPPL